jgi:hypothetical protein
MYSNDPIACHANGRTCHASHVVGEIPQVNNDTATVSLNRLMDSVGGGDTYTTTWFSEFGQDLNLCLSLGQTARLIELLQGALAMHELYRDDDDAMHAQVTK